MKIVIGATGASGSIYLQRLLEQINNNEHEVHLVMTAHARQVADHELLTFRLPPKVLRHADNDMNVPFVSGSTRFDAMVIVPCSMKSMGGIAHSLAGDLLVRAADVVLKERKKLVLVVRETPLHLGHLEAMASLTRMGAIIFPPVPAFYHRPKTLNDVINQTVTRILDQFDIDVKLFHRWDDEGMSRHPDASKTTPITAAKERKEAKKQR